jgi:hypothetical protein
MTLNDNNFNKIAPYIAGLIEGDGTLITPSLIRNNSNKKLYCYIRICFNIKDLKLAEFLLNIIGGSICFNKNKTYCLLTINKLEEVIFIINNINGYFRTPKIEALKRLINFLNINYNQNIVTKELDNSCLSSNN